MGRLLARSDILMMLENRLWLTEVRKQHPEIAAEQITQPVFILGLSRSGTSILFEILSEDPMFRVPKYWEALFPCPPPEAATYESDPRVARAEGVIPNERICDVLYKYIVVDPIDTVRRVYAHFGFPLTDGTIERMQQYIASKPKGKFGQHKYDLDSADDVAKEHAVFRRYQERYGIVNEP